MSTLDWALIETWKDAGIPLEAVLRGIDSAFDSYDRKPARAKTRKVNSLAYCAQEVLVAAEEMKEASVGRSGAIIANAGLGAEEIRQFLHRNCVALLAAQIPPNTRALANQCVYTVETLA